MACRMPSSMPLSCADRSGLAPGVVEKLELIFDWNINAIKRGNLVWRADRCALGARAIVASNVNDQGVVELAQIFDGLDHATDLMVGVGPVSGEHIRLADEHLLFVCR